MKKQKLLFATLLTLVATTTLLSCNSKDTGPNIKGEPVEEPEAHYVDGMLHEFNVSESSTPFITNGQCEYSIIYEKESEWGDKAALFLQRHFKKAVDVAISIIEYDGTNFTYDANKKIICIDVKDVLTAANITSTDKPIGNAGYHLLTKDNSVFIQCNSGYGYVNACRTFLNQVFGYEIYAADVIIYKKDGATLPNMDIYEAPDMTYKFQSNKADDQARYEMGFLNWGEAFYNRQNVPTQHNVLTWLPKSVYLDSSKPETYHPKWYNRTQTQICWTAHGDKDEYNILVDTLFEKFKEALTIDPDVGTIQFSQEDRPELCSCEGCLECIKKYGADSATMVLLLNDVDVKLQAWLEEQAEINHTNKREVNLAFFAYQNSERPCAHKDENGTWVPNHEDVICRDHVVPYIAPIFAKYEESFYSKGNDTVRDTINGWKALSKYAYFWIYETNFSNYIYPFNSYATMIDTYRYIIDNGAQFLFNEGQHDNDAVPCFGKFKEYFNYVTLNDVNAKYSDIVESFFTNYFNLAKEPMLKMFYEIQEYMLYLRQTYPTELDGTIYEDISQTQFWPLNILQRWQGYCDEAFKAIEKIKTSNLALYTILYRHIVLESIFPQFAILDNHRGKFSNSQVNEMVKKLLSDCQLAKVTKVAEGRSIIPVISAWSAM